MINIDLYHFIYSPVNILSVFMVLAFIIIWGHLKSDGIEDTKMAFLFRLNIYHKLLFAFIYGVYYIFIFKGGDTYAYWKTMGVYENLMFHDFSDFWHMMTSEPSLNTYSSLFNYKTGYPESYIYLESEAFNATKIMYPLRLITFNSYFACTFLMSFFMANASWKIYTLAKKVAIFQNKLMSIFILFLPSVAFWCSGISKDTIVYTSILYIIYYLYLFVNEKGKGTQKVKYGLYLLFFTYLIYCVRPFILNAMIIPLTLMYSTSLLNKIQSFALLRIFVKTIIYMGVFGGFIYIVTTFSANEFVQSSSALEEAMIIQQDFLKNTETYGEEEGDRYSLGEIDFSPTGIIKAIPLAILAGVYRPYLWEALSPAFFFNGLESAFIILLTFWFFLSNFRARLTIIQKNEILMFSIGFIFIIAFMAGFTSILFGVLVRIRAPLLPFLGLILTLDIKKSMSLKTENNKQVETK